MLIFEESSSGRRNKIQSPKLTEEYSCHINGISNNKVSENKKSDNKDSENFSSIPKEYLRTNRARLPEVSELQVVRHYTKLSQKNFSIDTQFYPLGSCTMKYNPRSVQSIARLPGFLLRHPLFDSIHSQGFLQSVYELQEMLKTITGMAGVSLTPMAGAQGEFAGVLMIRAYHHARNETERDEILVPDSAHGTNPASAAMCGYKIKEIITAKNGDLDIAFLKRSVNERTAGIMLTNPSTIGLFEHQIENIATIIHQKGGLLYYDGANLNALLGKLRPEEMGFDVMHMNLHKTFATPHGGGGPGSGPVAANEKLRPFLPIPMVDKNDNEYVWLSEKECPNTIGRLSCFMGNAGILLRALGYLRLLGREGLSRVSDIATLNANYLMMELKSAGFTVVYPKRRAAHEFVISFKKEAENFNVNAMDFAKRLLDFDIHAPTTYFPLMIPECWLIEPTETESKEELDHFVKVMKIMLQEAKDNPAILKSAPNSLSVSRLDDVKAARFLDVNFWDFND